jgi:hypothetical protein
MVYMFKKFTSCCYSEQATINLYGNLHMKLIALCTSVKSTKISSNEAPMSNSWRAGCKEAYKSSCMKATLVSDQQGQDVGQIFDHQKY